MVGGDFLLLATNLSLLIEDEEGLCIVGAGQQGSPASVVSPNVLISSLGKRDANYLVQSPSVTDRGWWYRNVSRAAASPVIERCPGSDFSAAISAFTETALSGLAW
jgi:hypothetical protein